MDSPCFVVTPGFGNFRSHSSQSEGFAHLGANTVWTACVNAVVGDKLCLVRFVQDQRQNQEAQPGRLCNAVITEVHCYGLSKHRQHCLLLECFYIYANILLHC